MKTLWIKILAFVCRWPKACKHIKAAMVTPMLSMRDKNVVKKQAKQLAKSRHYNSVAALIDLQAGRPYIKPGRTRTKLTKEGERNLRIVLGEGITPVVVCRNDWAQRNKQSSIPSLGNGPALADQAAFYSDAMLDQELGFLDSLSPYWPHIHIQLNIEPYHPDSARFALLMAQWLRSKGFKGQLWVNPYDKSVAAHAAINQQLADFRVEWARSWHAHTPSPDPVWNTDGNLQINSGNAKVYLQRIADSGKQMILWSKELANCPNELPGGYL